MQSVMKLLWASPSAVTKNNKATYVTLLSLDEAKEQAAAATQKALAALDGFDDKARFLRDLAVYLSERVE